MHQILDLTQVILQENSSETANDEQDTHTTKWMELVDRSLKTICSISNFLSDHLTSDRSEAESRGASGSRLKWPTNGAVIEDRALRRALVNRDPAISISLKTDVRWYYQRLAFGTSLCFDTGPGKSLNLFSTFESVRNPVDTYFEEQLRLIENAFLDCRDSVLEDPCSLPYELLYRLDHCRSDNPDVGNFLKSVERMSERPYILPFSSRFEQIGKLKDAVFVWPRRYRRVGVLLSSRDTLVSKEENDLVRINLATGSELKKWRYRARVTCMDACADESTVVSGSSHCIVLIW